MKLIWRVAVLSALMMFVLCVGKRINVRTLALWITFPNVIKAMEFDKAELPITSEIAQREFEEKIPLAGDWQESFREQLAKENVQSFATLLEHEENSGAGVMEEPLEFVYTEEQLKDFEFLMSRIYNVDGNTATNARQLDSEKLLSHDFHVDKDTEGPQILIYHTHSQEAFADSIPGDESTSIVGMGSYLTTLLQRKGFKVLHHKESFDMVNGVLDRNKAYTNAEPVIAQLIKENPSIQIVIDLHRDGVGENVHLVKEIDGKPTAQVMFFNGLSYSAKNGAVDYLYNPYLENNLAMTMQLKLAADTLAPGFARKIYLKSLRFNLHLHPGAMLIEAGAQTNTVEEMQNAMEVLARILGNVLY